MPRDPNVEIFIKYACRKLPEELPIRLRGGFRIFSTGGWIFKRWGRTGTRAPVEYFDIVSWCRKTQKETL